MTCSGYRKHLKVIHNTVHTKLLEGYL